MRYNNKSTEVQLILGTRLTNQIHLASADVGAAVIDFGAVAATMEIV